MSMEESAVVESEVVDSTPEYTSAPESASASTPTETSPAAASAPPQQTVWDAFRTLPDFQGQDDTAIARRLYSSMEREKAATQALAQYQQYIPYAQQYLQQREPFEQFQQHRESFQRWLSSQQQPANVERASAAEAVKKWWNPPEVRESYKQYLVRDENGREVISPEAPLDAKHSLYEYQKYKADFAQKFLTNPEEAIGPMIQEIAQQQAQQIVQAQFEEAHAQQYVSSLEQENRDWLYEADGKTPTEEGQAIEGYINEAASLGIQSAEARWEYATMKVELDLHNRLRAMQAQTAQRSAFEAGLPQQTALAAPPAVPVSAPVSASPDAPSQAQKDIEFLRREASRNPSRSTGTSDPRAPQAPMTFEQRLAKQLQRDGIS
jgi:hypothetical protein